MILSYVLFSLIGIGIIMLGVMASNFGGDIMAVICFAIGIIICIISFVAARRLIDIDIE